MLKVRRSLTEILLEVTNEEISAVCREVWSRARAKGTPDRPDRLIERNFRYLTARTGPVSPGSWPLAALYENLKVLKRGFFNS